MLRENDFDKHFEKASAIVGLPVALFKSICAVESGFDPYFQQGNKLGIAGMPLRIAKQIAAGLEQTIPGLPKDPIAPDLISPETSLLFLAGFLRLLYSKLENCNMFDVWREYAVQCETKIPHYDGKCWDAYQHYSQKQNEPHSYMPHEVDGVSTRYKERIKYGD
jgi:hypothetical protein